MKHLAILLFACLLFVIPATAQDILPDVICDLPALQDNINVFIGELGKLREETDLIIIADTLQRLANGANLRRAACDGLSFSGNAPKVIAPVNFPSGIYRAIATTTDYITVTVTAAQGECGSGATYYGTSLFLVSESGEAVFGSKGCDAIIEVSSVRDTWTLKFERLTTG